MPWESYAHIVLNDDAITTSSFKKSLVQRMPIIQADITRRIQAPRQAWDPPRKAIVYDQVVFDEDCTVHTVLHVGDQLWILSCTAVIGTTSPQESLDFQLTQVSYLMDDESLHKLRMWDDNLGCRIGFENLPQVYDVMVHVLAILQGERIFLKPKDVQVMVIVYSIASALIWGNKCRKPHTLLCLEGDKQDSESSFFVRLLKEGESVLFWRAIAEEWGCNAIANFDRYFHNLYELLFP
jgi:hypothetical protein